MKVLAVIFILYLGVALIGKDSEALEQERKHYCDMREMHQESRGQYGWPENADSRFTDEDCLDD